MINLDSITNENTKEHNEKWPFIPDRKDVGVKYCNYPNPFIECSNKMDDGYQNIDDCNQSRKRKILIVFDNMIAAIVSNKKFQAIINKLFIRSRK